MKRFWVSWWTGNYADEGCTKPPFKFWVSGQKERLKYGLSEKMYARYLKLIQKIISTDNFLDKHARDDCSICAVIDAESETDVWKLVSKHFPDHVQRFCEEKALDWKPGDRFL
jgi:hypothetical protein